MRKILISVFITLFPFIIFGQKADFKSAERFLDVNLAPKLGDLELIPNWLENQDMFWYTYKTSAGRNWYLVNAASKTKQSLFDSRYMAAELKKHTHHPYNELDLPIRNIEFEKKSVSKFTFNVDSIKFRYDITNRKLTIIDTIRRTRTPEWAGYSPDSTWVVYARNHNLFIIKSDDKDSIEYKLTDDGELNYSFAGFRRSQDTVRNKRVRANVRWFKNSQKFYVLREDSRKVKDLFIIDVLAQPRPELVTYKYSMPGDQYVPQPELIVFDAETKKRTNIDLNRWKDQTISVEWMSQKSAEKMIVVRRDRTLKKLDVCMVNTNTGDVSELFSEETWPYFNDDYSAISVLNEGNDIIWWSERTGWGQLYLYDGNGNLKQQITDGYYVTGRIERIDTLGRMIYFEAFGREPGNHPYYSMKYKASIDRGEVTLVTKEMADHTFSMSGSAKYFVDTYSTVETEPKSVLRDNKGNVILDLEKADLSQLYATGWKMPETFVIKAKDGVTDLYGVIYKPFNFDSTRKYPIISYVYPGPQTDKVPFRFTYNGEKNVALAQLGFIVVHFGHRGSSPMRSAYYHTFGYSDLRDYALADDKYGIEQLAERYSFIDLDKVGIYGRSGGGFMSTAALLTYPDFYDAAVSPSGNHDNNIYNQWWSETHNGVTAIEKKVLGGEPQVSYKATVERNQELVKNLKGHLLLIHGNMDNNVHPGNTLRVVDALMKANKRFDLIIAPAQAHTYGNDTDYLDRAMWYYFAEHLLGDYRDNVDITDYK